MVALIAVLAVCVAVGVFFLLKKKDTAMATPLPTPVLSTTWVFQHSVGMPAGPTPEGEGFVFDFPLGAGSVHYLVRGAPGGGSEISASFVVEATQDAVFNYKLNPNNTGSQPPSAHLYFQRVGDTVTGQGDYEYYRWWAVEPFLELKPGSTTADLSVLLTPDKWISVYGKRGDTNETTQAFFKAAVSNMGSMGLTFGGGSFYGHGLNLTAGAAKFYLKNYRIQ